MSIGDIIGVPGAPTLTSEDVQRLMDQRDEARAQRDTFREALELIASHNPARASVAVTIARNVLQAESC